MSKESENSAGSAVTTIDLLLETAAKWLLTYTISVWLPLTTVCLLQFEAVNRDIVLVVVLRTDF
jgi:hypothetical protein